MWSDYLIRDKTFRDKLLAWANMAVPDWVKIWFLASSAASVAKSASRMVDMLVLLFCTLFIRLEEVNSKQFCRAPMLLRESLALAMAASKR